MHVPDPQDCLWRVSRSLLLHNGQHEFTEVVTVLECFAWEIFPFASFTVYMVDKDKARVADARERRQEIIRGGLSGSFECTREGIVKTNIPTQKQRKAVK